MGKLKASFKKKRLKAARWSVGSLVLPDVRSILARLSRLPWRSRRRDAKEDWDEKLLKWRIRRKEKGEKK